MTEPKEPESVSLRQRWSDGDDDLHAYPNAVLSAPRWMKDGLDAYMGPAQPTINTEMANPPEKDVIKVRKKG